jgi:tetratricopeptide (TPR) repeat protein
MAALAKKLALGFGTTIVFFALVELILLAAGVEPLYERTDPYIGFSGYAPLFIKSTSPDGKPIFKTAFNKIGWFNPQNFPARKSEGTTRIFCLGGSTTYGRPYDDRTSFSGWLREFLPKVDPDRQWEVINAGGISYASYRVTRLMEELVNYEPDVFIVYSGHNEFLEKRTYDKLLKTPELVRNIGALASRMRLYSALFDVTYERGAVLSTEVEAVLDESVGPDYYHRDDEMRDAVLEHYRTSLVRMTHIARRAGAELILITPASNIRDFSPFKTEPGPEMSVTDIEQVNSHKHATIAALDEGDYTKALAISKRALDLDDRDAESLYLQGRALSRLGRMDEARKAFINARDEDVCPLRALTPIRSIITDVAQTGETGLVDFAGIVDQRSPNGIPGSELFLDHVHPTIEGNRILALAIIQEMANEGIVSPVTMLDSAAISAISEQVESSLDEQAHAAALLNLSRVLMWAGKNDEAERLVDNAVSITSDDSDTHLQKAMLFQRAGNDKAALIHYREAANLAPLNPAVHHTFGVFLSKLGQKSEARTELETAIRLKPDLVEAHYDLGVVLDGLGEDRQAEVVYRIVLQLDRNHADAHNNLGVILARRGNIAAASEQFAKALQIDPSHENAANNLARARAAQGR